MNADKMANIIEQIAFWSVILLSLYMAVSTLLQFQDVSTFHATFVFAIISISSLEYIKNQVLKIKDRKFLTSLFFLLTSMFIFAASITTTLYVVFNAQRLQVTQPFFSELDSIVGWFLIGVVVFLTWVHWGKIIALVLIAGIAYFLWGHLIPMYSLSHSYYDLNFCLSYLGMNATTGIFGFVGLLTDQLYFLIVLATALLSVGMLTLFFEIGRLVGRYVKGGAAFPAIFGSAAVGSVMGQAVANVALTGQLTIPMMKRYGFKGTTAGAIEAVASTTGQLLPPILGLAAFIIAAFLNIPYIDVALSAVYPAFLFIATICLGVWLRASGEGMTTLKREAVDVHGIILLLPTLIIPFSIVLYLMLNYWTPSYAGLVGLPLVFVFALLQGKKRPKLSEVSKQFHIGFRLITLICLLGIAIGPFAQVITVTQVASKIGTFFMAVFPGNLFILLVIIAAICILAGMGLPTPVAYLLVALTVTPFVQNLGIPALQAHFFVFYFAIFSTITPPIAISCLAATRISNAGFHGTCLEAMKLAAPAFIFPFSMVYNPSILEFPNVTWTGLYWLFMTLVVQISVSIGMIGYFISKLKAFDRPVFLLSGAISLTYLVNHNLLFLFLFLPVFVGICIKKIFQSNETMAYTT